MSSSLNRIKKSIMASMQSASKQGTSAYDTTAVVRRIEGDTAWVHIAGGVDETPVKLTIAAKAGDTVQVRVGGGRAWITGNATAPPTDDQKANEANDKAVEADVKAGRALKDASDAMDEAKSAQDEANQLAINMANAVVRINADIENLQDQIDGNITTWFYDYDPTTSNLPASEWISEGTESAHIGDLFYNNTSGYSWRWQVTNGVYSWQRVTDTDVAKALADAAKAQDTADSKRRVFYTQPVPPYDKGDLWVQGSGGDILRCAQDKVEGQVYVASDWVLASKYTDDSALNTWLANTYAADKTSIQSQIDGKAETWYQAADPATNWTAAEKQAHTGDLWYRTSDDTTWYYTGSAWNQQQVPTSVFNAIDGKANIFVGNSTPTDPKDGDLWMQSASSDILTYVGGRWSKYNKYTDDTVANEAKTMATATQEHFWSDSEGAHITRKTQQEYSANPANGGGNLFMKSNEVNLRKGLTPIAKFYTSSTDKGIIQLGSDQEDGGYNYTRLAGGDGTFELSTAGPWNPTSAIEGASLMEFVTTNTYTPLNSYFKIEAATGVAFEFNSNGYGGMACYLYHNGRVVLYGSNGDDTKETFSISNDGDLTIMGHSSPIGTRIDWQPGTASSISTGQTWTKLSSSGKTLTPGTYLVVGSLNWSANATGNRAARLYNETTGTALSHTEVQVRAATGATTRMQVVGSVVLDSTCSICVQVWQDSGSARTVTPTFTYTRIA